MKQCRHEFDTQMNEGMNNSVAFYVPKGLNFSGTTSLKSWVFISSEVQLVGHHYFWTSILSSPDVTPTPQLVFTMINRDKYGVQNYIRAHNFDNMAKRNRAYHDRFQKEFFRAGKDRKRGLEYKYKSGCLVAKQTNNFIHMISKCGSSNGHKTARLNGVYTTT